MTTRNDITGDEIKTKEITDKYRENFDLIFGKPKPEKQKQIYKPFGLAFETKIKDENR
jgi:hypothetical protein